MPKPMDRLAHVRYLTERMTAATRARMSTCASRAAALSANLDHLSPEHVLARGYSVVRDERGRIVQSSRGIAAGDLLDIRFASGQARARVEESR